MQFQDFDIDTFLRDYWQKQPLLIRNPWRDWENPLAPDELAGLACEAGVESRLVFHKDKASAKRGPAALAVEQGPLLEERFETLDKAPWTILVQAVDQHVPAVAELIAPFRFIPNWRIDDVMVSYATDGGGVGPHYDQYDVFLIQGLGRRRWRLGARCGEDARMLPHDELRLLAEFESVQEWVLEPGDILYVPPGVSHDGIGVGDDCMTYSVGFRAPARSELIAYYCDDVLERLCDDDRYADPDLVRQDNAAGHNPGEIAPEALARLHEMVTARMLDRDAFARWFGEYSSTPKYAEVDGHPEEPIDVAELRAMLADGEALHRNPASRFSFVRQGEGAVVLFVDGRSFDCVGDGVVLAERLCVEDVLDADAASALSDEGLVLLAALYNQGSLGFEDDADDDEDGDE
jgi:50S ribosomal protein L16 3-hydroxylase